MRRIALLCCSLAALVACGKSETPATDTSKGAVAAPPPAPPPAPTATPISLDSLAGKWNATATPTSGTDTTSTKFVLTATKDTTGWTITFPGRKPMPVHVSVSSDSVLMDIGPYSSVRRKGVTVTTHSVGRLQNGKLVSTITAHYKTTQADSVVQLKSEATKAP